MSKISKNINKDTFEKIVKKYEQQLLLIAKSRLRDSSMAKAAVQETFISLYVNARKIKNYKKLKSWLVIVLINNCNKIMRDFYKKGIKSEPLEKNTNLYEDNVEFKYLLDNINFFNIIDFLDIDERTIITMFFLEDYKITEISEILNTNIGTIKSKISRIKDKIAELLIEKINLEKKEVSKFNKEEIDNMISIGNKKKKVIFTKRVILVSCTVLFVIIFSGFIVNNYIKTDSKVNIVADDSINSDKNLSNNDEDNKILYINYETDELKDISDIEVLKEDAHQIVIAKVSKIDGCTNYNEKSGNYTRINTLGDIEILQVLKGDLEVNSIVPFIRGGGTISYNDYQKGVVYGNRSKIQDTYEYVTEKRKGDIEIEEGKTYLMFLYYDSYNERYEIIELQNSQWFCFSTLNSRNLLK